MEGADILEPQTDDLVLRMSKSPIVFRKEKEDDNEFSFAETDPQSNIPSLH